MKKVGLEPLKADDKERFILDNQEAFRYGATEEFGMRDDHFEEDGEIISRATIEKAIEEGEAYRILCDGEVVGGAVVRVNGDKGDLDLLFVSPHIHSKGIGYAAWCEIEQMCRILKSAISTFMSTAAAFISLNSSTATIPTRTIPICKLII